MAKKETKRYSPTYVLDERGLPIRTANMTDEEFSRIRAYKGHFINSKGEKVVPSVVLGGSDLGVIGGHDDYKSLIEFYHKKIGIMEKYPYNMDTQYMDAGHFYEEAIAKTFVAYMKKHCNADVELLNDDHIYTNEAYPFMHANLDYRIVKINGHPVNGVLEIKTCHNKLTDSSVVKNWEVGIPPEKYVDQVTGYMATMNADFTYFACACVSKGLRVDDLCVAFVKRDLEREKLLMDSAASFCRCVETGEEPVENTPNIEALNKHYQRLYGDIGMTDEAEPSAIEFPEATRELFETLTSVEEKLKEISKQESELKNSKQAILAKLYPMFKDAGSNYGTFRLDEERIASVKVSASRKRSSLDLSLLREKYPEIYDRCTHPMFDEAMFKENASPTEMALIKKDCYVSELNPEGSPSFRFSIKQRKSKLKKA